MMAVRFSSAASCHISPRSGADLLRAQSLPRTRDVIARTLAPQSVNAAEGCTLHCPPDSCPLGSAWPTYITQAPRQLSFPAAHHLRSRGLRAALHPTPSVSFQASTRRTHILNHSTALHFHARSYDLHEQSQIMRFIPHQHQHWLYVWIPLVGSFMWFGAPLFSHLIPFGREERRG